MKNLAIIGGGSWGTALAIALAPRFPLIRLWVYEADLAGRMRSSRQNDIYLPGCELPPPVAPRQAVERLSSGLSHSGNE